MLFKIFFCLLWMPFCLAERHTFSIFAEGHSRNIPVKLFQNPLTGLGRDVFKVTCCQMHDNLCLFSIFCSGGLFVKKNKRKVQGVPQ